MATNQCVERQASMSRALNDLDYRLRNVAFEFLGRCSEAGIPVMIIDTLRTQQEQEANLAKGVSWTPNSLHLPQKPDGKALAIDVCPYGVYQLHGPDKLAWDANEPAWQVLGKIGETLGLGWGGRWKQKDMGHFEYRSLADRANVIGTLT